MRGDTDNFAELFLNDVPMMDARAPVEFTKGAFPGVVNLPLMNDLERQKVGTCYKQQGQQAAIELPVVARRVAHCQNLVAAEHRGNIEDAGRDRGAGQRCPQGLRDATEFHVVRRDERPYGGFHRLGVPVVQTRERRA